MREALRDASQIDGIACKNRQRPTNPLHSRALISERRGAHIESASNPRQDVVPGHWREALYTAPAVVQAFLLEFVAHIEAPFSAVFRDDVQAGCRS